MELICIHCLREFGRKSSLSNHQKRCKDNPNRVPLRVVWNKGLTNDSDVRVKNNSDRIGLALKGKPGHIPSDKTRKQVSESMKNAHKEGRAHNIGSSRWNNEPSYPEKFFMGVIENEFSDKNYVREFPFNRFSLDFAWVSKKICIEIDGEQHYRFEDYQERDRRKDAELVDAGWKVLRIRWKEMFDNPKYWIEVAKIFVCPGS